MAQAMKFTSGPPTPPIAHPGRNGATDNGKPNDKNASSILNHSCFVHIAYAMNFTSVNAIIDAITATDCRLTLQYGLRAGGVPPTIYPPTMANTLADYCH